MAKEPNKPEQARTPPQEETQGEESRKKPIWKAFALKHWVVILVSTSVISHAVMLYFHGFRAHAAQATSNEVSLGEYQFINLGDPTASVSKAVFSLHIQLLSDVDSKARTRLTMRRYKVEQDVEELLRQAHAGDFDDPTLSELKRQIQEKINATLEMRAIADVIITDLEFRKQEVIAKTENREPAPLIPNPGNPNTSKSVKPAGGE